MSNFTQAQIDDAINNLASGMATAASRYIKGEVYGYCECEYYGFANRCLRFMLFLQSWSGGDNGCTDEQLNAVMAWQKIHCPC